MNSRSKTLLIISLAIMLQACSSSSDNDDDTSGTTADDGSSATPGSADTPAAEPPPAGNILQYGSVNVGDDAGTASDTVAVFFELASGIAETAITDMLDPATVNCEVRSDDDTNFNEISTGYLPDIDGIGVQGISAGESVLLSSAAGTYVELEQQVSGSFLFYDLSNQSLLPDGPVPTGLTADITGDMFPAFAAVSVPDVAPLTGFTMNDATSVTAGSTFTWDAGSATDAKIRIFSVSGDGGFFAEDGKKVSCLVPDTGSFSFPGDIQSELGADFVGSAPLISRAAFSTESQTDALLILVRESFL